MKTTKDIAELFSQEIERISRGEVRKDVITGLEKCSNSMIKLARLEMDYAWREWTLGTPNVPWLSTQNPTPPTPTAQLTEAPSQRIQDLEKQITAAIDEFKKPSTSETRKAVLKTKIDGWHDKITFLRNTAGTDVETQQVKRAMEAA